MTTDEKRPAIGTLVWALDPRESSLAPGRAGIQELKAWADAMGLAVQPVYVLPPSKLRASGSPDKSEAVRKLAQARQDVSGYLAAIGADWAKEPVALVGSPGADAVDRLLRFAHGEGAELIAVSSHGRSGVPRLVLGSFAERLLGQSELPVLFLTYGGEAAPPSGKKVLFSTDFSEASKRAFTAVLEYCARTSAELILFHQVGLSPLVESTLAGAAVLPENFFDEQRAWAEKEASSCADRAKARGVPFRSLVVSDRGEASSLILETAHRIGAGLITMATQSGSFERAILGSVSQGVYRAHSVPVCVFGPRCGSAEAKHAP